MNILWALIFLVVGLIMLWKSAEFLVAGAVSLAERLGISPLIVGLTVVAMGTSAPEAASSIVAVFKENGGDIAIGNVFGSNIANLALVGGLIALIRPIKVRKQTLLREIPAMLLVTVLLWPLLGNSYLSGTEATALLVVFGLFLLFMVYMAGRESSQAKQQNHNIKLPTGCKTMTMNRSILFVVGGLAGLALGAKLTVEGAVYIGEQIGLSKAVIGLTIIAVGTSLPELVTCVVAAIKAQDDISVGNLVGSNIFNILLVCGTAGVVRPFEVAGRFAGGLDYWIMIIVSVAFVAAAVIGRGIITRFFGLLLLGGYAAYIAYLFIPTVNQ